MLLPLFALGALGAVLWWWSNSREGEHSPEQLQTHQPYMQNNAYSSADTDMIVKGYVKGVERNIVVRSIGNGFSLRVDAAHDFMRMNEACLAEAGTDLPVSTAFRTMEEQQDLYATLGPTIAAKPGYSNHQGGVAIDLHGLDSSKSNYDSVRDSWLSTNCKRFGWIRAGLNFSHKEPWHLEYET